ncbi:MULTISPECIES: permease-like cell division protein FtsX [Clostridia]|uniref:permease-like cell division protein FtsX n=1 Tax=Clostridium sp. CCUG 7971 TaxID=2811414 RepID=UPI001ABAAD35|nr:permease-like cell division protein FtsX [Clostridium sp. CCUG 7971]MBO3446354.1 ABC transporter permease [Clostridium sp. CCUG 7971]
MKLVSKCLYSLKQGIKGIFSNKTMSFISVISVTSALIILGIVFTIVLNINQLITFAKDEINEVRVSMKANISEEDREKIKEDIKKITGVKEAEYKTKEEALSSMKKSWGEEAYLLDGIKNPLDDYYLVKIDNPDKLKEISSKMLKLDGVEDVKFHQDIMQNFLNISNIVKKFGSIIIIALLLICLVIISNTIKSRVYSKKEEIQIIKYVGASNGFIIAPFIVEGFTIGMIGSLLAVGACIGMYGYILEKTTSVISRVVGNVALPLTSISMSLIAVLVITGITIGVLGSVLSVKKHLKV